MILYDVIYIFASWENRFPLSIKRMLNGAVSSKSVSILYNVESAARTAGNRAEAKTFCAMKGIECSELELWFEKPAESWETLKACFHAGSSFEKRVLVEYSTMPRETVWLILQLLRSAGAHVDYIYHKPKTYSGDGWISRDPTCPRLVYKLSGVSQLGLSTALLVVTGFDIERTQMLVNRFEPSKLLLGLQIGEQHDNQRLNVECHRKRFETYEGVEMFDIDAFAANHGLDILNDQIAPLIGTHNVIASSLGPKPSAVGLLKLTLIHPEIALAYTPSREYNEEYSSGIGDSIAGSFDE